MLNILKKLLGRPKTKKGYFFYTLALFIIVVAVGRLIQVYSGNFYTGVREPYLQSMSHHSVVIRWQTLGEVIGTIRYGLQENNLEHKISETDVKESHELTLSGLSANTKYFYAIESNSKNFRSGSEYWFKTSPLNNSADPVRIWLLGDPGYASKHHLKVKDRMHEWVSAHAREGQPEFDLILTTGDNAYSSGTNKQFQKHFFNVYDDVLINTPVWPAYGNHDARRWAFFNIFTFPENAESGGVASQSENYYSFDYGNVHFVMLDSFDGAKSKDDEMLRWLRKDLAANKSDWLIAVMHHPPYSKGNQDSDDRYDSRARLFHSRENILPLLEEFGVDLVLSGHSHSYERSRLVDCHYGESDTFEESMVVDNGIFEDGVKVFHKSAQEKSHQGSLFAVVGSTAKLNPTGTFDHPVMDIGLAVYGSLLLDIDESSLKGAFIDENGELKDEFKLIKDVDKRLFSTRCR